jgi:uncharacterized membrane protein (UPF0127 family)
VAEPSHVVEFGRAGGACASCCVAASPGMRLRGLLGRDGLAADEALLLRDCWAVHTWFMRFPIDVVFLDEELRVVAVVENLAPWHSAARRRARHVLELAAGEGARRGVAAGDTLTVRERPAIVMTEDRLGVPAT